MSFDRLGLSPELLRVVAREGYTTPTPVQDQAIPLVLAGRDVMAGAQTGTGKTAAFVLPMLQRLHAARPRWTASHPRADPGAHPRARAPGRGERPHLRRRATHQVGRDLRRRRLRSAGPRPARRSRDRRRDARPPARPRRPAAPSTCRRSRSSSSTRPTGCSTWASSATSARCSRCCPPSARTCSSPRRSRTRSGRSPPGSCTTRPRSRSTRGTPRPSSSSSVVIRVDRERKRELLSHLVKTGVIYQALVFTRTKHGANRLAKQLEQDGIPTTAIHGNKSQPQRVRALADFKANRYAILVATEVAARGLDIDAPAARRQLRAADGPRGLRPPHRADRPRRGRRRGRLAGLHRRGAHAPRHRARARPVDPVRGHPRLRARSAHPPRADPPWRARWRTSGRRAARPSPAASESRAACRTAVRGASGSAVRRSPGGGSRIASGRCSPRASDPGPWASSERWSRTPSGRSPVPTGPVAWSAAAAGGSSGAGSKVRQRSAAST